MVLECFDKSYHPAVSDLISGIFKGKEKQHVGDGMVCCKLSLSSDDFVGNVEPLQTLQDRAAT